MVLRRRRIAGGVFIVLCFAFLFSPPAHATPFGKGVFGANTPFGSADSLSINLGNNVSLSLTPNGSTFSGTGSHVVTVTTTDAVGYTLYVHAMGNTSMVNGGGATIAASANSSPGVLANNTWGYNTTGSASNFIGMTTTDSIVKDANGPFVSGDPTTVTYGAVTDAVQPAGNYSVALTYTAVAKNE